jgi:hypothetical protein
MAAKVLWQNKDYTVQNFPLEPRANGLPRREGGKFRPLMYGSDEDTSHFLSVEEYRERYAPTFKSGAAVEQDPSNKCGTGNRRISNKNEPLNSSSENHGMIVLPVFLTIGCGCCVIT